MFRYNIVINRVVDGDTIDVDIDLGFDVWLKNKRVRLAQFDAAESRTSDKVEDAVGEYTRDLIKYRYPECTSGVLQSEEFHRGKYGRIIGNIVTEHGLSWSGFLLDLDLVVAEKTHQSAKTAFWHGRYEELLEQGLIGKHE